MHKLGTGDYSTEFDVRLGLLLTLQKTTTDSPNIPRVGCKFGVLITANLFCDLLITG